MRHALSYLEILEDPELLELFKRFIEIKGLDLSGGTANFIAEYILFQELNLERAEPKVTYPTDSQEEEDWGFGIKEGDSITEKVKTGDASEWWKYPPHNPNTFWLGEWPPKITCGNINVPDYAAMMRIRPKGKQQDI